MRQARRCKDDRALLEGPHLVAEAAAAGVEVLHLAATPEFLASAVAHLLLPRLPAAPEPVAPAVLESVLDADSPRGVAALVRLPRGGVAELPRRPGGVYVYLAGLQDPGNVGALARAAEAAGATALALGPGTAHPNHPRALRASAGSLLRLPVAVGVEVAVLADHLASLEARWVALATRGGADLWTADLGGALVLLLGSEGAGLPADVEARADLSLTIPLAPPVESLNATVAAALVLFEARRQRSAASPPSATMRDAR